MMEYLSKKNVALASGGLIVGVLSGIFLRGLNLHRNQQNAIAQVLSQAHSIREQDNTYQFINPLLAYDLPESKDFGEYADLETKLNDLIDTEKSQGKADEISVYFRGSQGHWVGINDTEKYYPASLLKVVVMIAYFQQAQTDPAILDKILTYTDSVQRQVLSSEYDAPSDLKLNQAYRAADLIHAMIVDSDNGATFTLINSLDGKDLDEVYSDFGLEGPTDAGNFTISAKDYSLFFRILYNATYLNRQYSNEAMQLLTEATFKDGLVGGLPAGTVVAHKFGEHVLTDNNGLQTGVELHDCGYVYGNQKYLLCVMTRGQKLSDLEQTIKDLSALVYKEAEK